MSSQQIYTDTDSSGTKVPTEAKKGTSTSLPTKLTPELVRELQARYPNLVRVGQEDGKLVIEVSDNLPASEVRWLQDRLVGDFTVRVKTPDAPAPKPSAPSPSGGTGGGGGGGGGAGGGPALSGGHEEGRPTQIAGGGKVWKVDDRYFMAYDVPGLDSPMVWELRKDHEDFEALRVSVDKTMTMAEFKKLIPILAGDATEIQITAEEPWRQFTQKLDKEAARRPWLLDPSTLAVLAEAYMEGRDPTPQELEQTDWWMESTAQERQLMEGLAAGGEAEARRILSQASEAWLGKTFGSLSDREQDRWLKLFNEDWRTANKFIDNLKAQRKALLPDFDEDLTWDQIVTPTRNLAENIWGQPFDDDRFLVDLVNKRDYNHAAQELRRVGLDRDVEGVVVDALKGLQRTALGDQVVRAG